MNSSIEITVDQEVGVLYAKRSGSHPKISRECDDDPGFIVSFDINGNPVGVILLTACDMSADFWFHHPSRNILPQDILEALDKWVMQRAKVKRKGIDDGSTADGEG